jgi:hypothetical protein
MILLQQIPLKDQKCFGTSDDRNLIFFVDEK